MSETVQMVMVIDGVSLALQEFPEGTTDFADWQVYDPAVHDPVYPPEDRLTDDFVPKNIFLFKLFTREEQVRLLTQVQRAREAGNWSSDTPLPLEGAYRALVAMREHMDVIGRIRVTDPETESFLDLCASLQVFGPDLAEQTRRIRMIKSGVLMLPL